MSMQYQSRAIYLSKLWMEFGMLFGLVGMIILTLILSYLNNFQGRESIVGNFIQKEINFGLHSDIYWPISECDDRHHKIM